MNWYTKFLMPLLPTSRIISHVFNVGGVRGYPLLFARAFSGTSYIGFARFSVWLPKTAGNWANAGVRSGLATIAFAGPPKPEVWVKRMDVEGASWTKLSPAKWADVDELRAAVIKERLMNIDPSLVELKLVRTTEDEPTRTEEAASVTLNPIWTWEKAQKIAGVISASGSDNRVWLLVVNKLLTERAILWSLKANRLYSAFLSAAVVPIANSESGASLVTLPEGIEWPQLEAMPLFVRPFYTDFYEGVLGSLDPSCTAQMRKATIIGNAGIGKSTFGLYLLLRAVQEKRTVIYRSEKVENVFIFHGDGRVDSFDKVAFALDLNANIKVGQLLADMSTVYICDGIVAPSVNAFTILITSPKRERWREFDKNSGAERFYFPVFSQKEMTDLLNTCFTHLADKEAVWKRYRMWGGIPRYVLDKIKDKDQGFLNSAIRSLHFDDLMLNMKAAENEKEDSNSHRCFHFKPKGEAADGSFVGPRESSSYDLDRSELGSAYIKKELYGLLDIAAFNKLQTFFATALDIPSAAKLYGDLFEPAALEAFSRGGKFKLYNLSTKTDAGFLELKASEKIFFTDASELAKIVKTCTTEELSARLLVPRSGTYTAIDAVLGQSKALVNVTINSKHGLKLFNKALTEGVIPTAAAMGIDLNSKITFYWALPQARYDEVCKKNVPFGEPIKQKVDKTALTMETLQYGADTKNFNRIIQFALLVPFKHSWRQDAVVAADISADSL